MTSMKFSVQNRNHLDAHVPSSVFRLPSAPTTTSKSKSAIGWSDGRISAFQPGPVTQRHARVLYMLNIPQFKNVGELNVYVCQCI